MPAMRPTGSPSRNAIQQRASQYSKDGLISRVNVLISSVQSFGT
jgi:hypothetical protein